MSTADTNLSGSDSIAAIPPASSAVRQMSTLSVLGVLIRREFWEHRALWMAPLVIAVLLVACAFPAHLDLPEFNSASADPRLRHIAWFALIQWGLAVPQYLVMAVVLNFYLLDCLYAERRDRSILFWKSLPVSDGATVAAKLLVSLLVVPLGVYVLSLATNLLFEAIWAARAALGYLPATVASWNTAAWLKVEGLMLLDLILSCLWYAPVAAYLLLVSAWARRSVFLWATLPPLFAVFVERYAFGTHYVWSLLEYRTGGIWQALHLRRAIEHTALAAGSGGAVFDEFDFSLFGNVDVWLGVLVAVGLAVATARIRRYRDDT